MELIRLSERVWYSMYEEERDRPCLGYIKGDRWSLAVDAGHSAAHVREFYEALEKDRSASQRICGYGRNGRHTEIL